MVSSDVGSAPHMRGIRPLMGVGICVCEDQPRTCGEYDLPQIAGDELIGSAPHMRGIRRPTGVVSPRWRISPAHAGNT